MKLSICITFLIALLPMVGHGEEKIKHMEPAGVSGVEALSSELRNLLSQEMRALQDGMMSIIPAHAAGNWHEIEIIAGKMKNSYILKQSLTKSQVKELHSVLPHEFIEKDQRFHYLAGMLEHVAKNKKPELINFYFSEMNESCVACHAKFAVHKFPNLKQKIESGHAH